MCLQQGGLWRLDRCHEGARDHRVPHFIRMNVGADRGRSSDPGPCQSEEDVQRNSSGNGREIRDLIRSGNVGDGDPGRVVQALEQPVEAESRRERLVRKDLACP